MLSEPPAGLWSWGLKQKVKLGDGCVQMNENEFETQLRADGYTEVETQTLEPRPGKGRHRHLFAIRGLVLSGTFTVKIDGEGVPHGVGQVFAVAEGQLHDEWIGPEGARILVGRKYSAPTPSAGL